MPVPTNLTALTAIDMGLLPYTNSQQVDSAGVTYDVWYSYTPPSGVTEIGVWGFGDLSVYKPTLILFNGPASAPVPILEAISAENIPVQIPVTPGVEVFFQFLTNSGNPTPANLAVNAQLGPTSTVPIGSIVVPDDNEEFPTSFLSQTTNYDVLGFEIAIRPCEAGDSLDSGTFLTDESGADSDTYPFNLYDASYNRTPISYSIAGSISIRVCKGAQNFYIGDAGDSGATIHAKILKSDELGAITVVAADLGGYGLTAVAAANAEDFVYLAGFGGSIGTAVKVWDVGLGAFTTNLHAAIANYQVFDILVLSNDVIVVGWFKASVTRDIIIKTIQADGTVLHTISYGSDTTGLSPHLSYALDDPTSFWLFVHLSSTNGETNFVNYNASTAAVISTLRYAEYENGMYGEAVTATPLARFGNSNSCPFWILLAEGPPPPPSDDHSGIYHILPGKTHDEIFDGASTAPTLDVKIPNPTARLFPLGD